MIPVTALAANGGALAKDGAGYRSVAVSLERPAGFADPRIGELVGIFPERGHQTATPLGFEEMFSIRIVANAIERCDSTERR